MSFCSMTFLGLGGGGGAAGLLSGGFLLLLLLLLLLLCLCVEPDDFSPFPDFSSEPAAAVPGCLLSEVVAAVLGVPPAGKVVAGTVAAVPPVPLLAVCTAAG